MENNSQSKLNGLIFENIRTALIARFGTTIPLENVCVMLKKDPPKLRAMLLKDGKVKIVEGKIGKKRKGEYVESSLLAKWISSSRYRSTRFALNVFDPKTLPTSQVDALLIGSPLFRSSCRHGHNSVRSTWSNTCFECAEERRRSNTKRKSASDRTEVRA